MHPGLSAKQPFKYTTLQPGEQQFCTVLMLHRELRRVLLVVGPKIAPWDTQVRFHGHLTNQRLVLEVSPYKGLEKAAIRVAATVMGKLNPSTFLSHQKRQFKRANRMMSDPSWQCLSFPYSALSVRMHKYVGIHYVGIRAPGKSAELVFQVLPLESGPSFKENLRFTQDLIDLCHQLGAASS
jgi:hypothetical protein